MQLLIAPAHAPYTTKSTPSCPHCVVGIHRDCPFHHFFECTHITDDATRDLRDSVTTTLGYPLPLDPGATIEADTIQAYDFLASLYQLLRSTPGSYSFHLECI